MFHWICPECGREIPPAVKECPACDPAAVPVAAAPAKQESSFPPPSPLSKEPEIAPEVLLAIAEEVRKMQARKPAPAPHASGPMEMAAIAGPTEPAAGPTRATPTDHPKTHAALEPPKTAVALLAAP